MTKIWMFMILTMITSVVAETNNEFDIILKTECRTTTDSKDPKAKANLTCVFPFIYQGVAYNGCTNHSDPEGFAWCATKVDSENKYILNSQNYGHCEPDCPIHRPELNQDEETGLIFVRTVGLNQKRCGPKETCVHYKKCPPYQAKLQELSEQARISTTSISYRKLRGELFSLVCDDRIELICCPKEELVTENNSKCDHECVTLTECPLITKLFLDGSKVETVRSLVCDETKPTFCCPEDNEDGAQGTTAKNEPIQMETEDPFSPHYLPINREKGDNNCGTTEDSTRIVGGKSTKPGTFPSAALLGAKINATKPHPFVEGKEISYVTNQFFCGGTLINRWFVLTAGHCIKDSLISLVVLGEWNIEQNPDCDTVSSRQCLPPVQTFDIKPEHNIRHPDYDLGFSNVRNDILLIKLPRMANLNEAVNVACLPIDMQAIANDVNINDIGDGLIGKRPIVVGWGHTDGDPEYWAFTSDFQSDGGGAASSIQQQLDVPIVDTSKCVKFGFDIDSEAQICSGGEEGKDSCSGDSGGPLYMSEFSNVTNLILPGNPQYLLGLVSFGTRGCGYGNPAVYTRVSYHIQWIKETIKKY